MDATGYGRELRLLEDENRRLRGALDEIASVALECRDAMEEPASKGVEWRMRSQITEAAMGFNQIANSASAALAATEPSERAADGEAQFRDGALLSQIDEELPSSMRIDGRLTEPDPEHPGAWRFKNEETS